MINIRKNVNKYLKNYKGNFLTITNSYDQGIFPLSTNGYLQKAFPELFPRGEMNLENAQRQIPVDIDSF